MTCLVSWANAEFDGRLLDVFRVTPSSFSNLTDTGNISLAENAIYPAILQFIHSFRTCIPMSNSTAEEGEGVKSQQEGEREIAMNEKPVRHFRIHANHPRHSFPDPTPSRLEY